MNIFYVNINDTVSKIGLEKLKLYAEKFEYSSKDRFLQHCAGRFLATEVCKNFYNIDNPKIITVDKKPKLENNEIYLSITHSKEYVMAVFDDEPCAIDLEKIRSVNLEKMSARYNKKFKALDDFFKYWTGYECSIKQEGIANFVKSDKFKNEYIYTVSSIKNNIKNIETENYFQ